MEGMEDQVQEEMVHYVTVDGAELTIENLEKSIALRKQELEVADFVLDLVNKGLFAKYFSINSRQRKIALATSHLVNPMLKNKMQDELIFHAHLESYLLSLVHEKPILEAEIESFEQEIETLMGSAKV